MQRRVLNLWRDESGVILPYVTVLLFVFVGLSALALDGARHFSNHSDTQKAIDAMAIAAAKELDGFPDALDRANAAIASITNSVEGSTVTADSVRYYSSLPAASVYPIPDSYLARDASQCPLQKTCHLVRNNICIRI